MRIKVFILISLGFLSLFFNAFFPSQSSMLIAQDTQTQNSSEKLENQQAQAITLEFHKIVHEAKSILIWLPKPALNKEDLQQPRNIFLPPKMLRITKILRKLEKLDYKLLNQQDYVDYMLITYHLFSKYEENKILKPAQTDARIYLPNFKEVFFLQKRKSNLRKLNYILSRIPQYKAYFDAGIKYLKNPHKDFLNETLKQMNDYINFLKNQLTIALLDRFAANPEKNWTQTVLRAILDAEKFDDFLKKHAETAVFLTDKQKAERTKFKFLQKLHYQHFIPENPKELLKFGKKMFEEISAQMRKIALIIRKDENWQQIIEELKQNHPAESELKSIAEAQLKEAQEFMKFSKVFPLPPRAFDVEVVEYIPKNADANTPFAFYQVVGRKSKGRYNIAYLPKDASPKLREEKLRDFFVDRMRIITVHECLPGHHLQFSYAQTVKRSELQRKLGYSTAYVEGWGLYSEQIMGELGFYKGLRGKLTMLKMRLWRAARVIIDVSRHFFGMTEEQAVKLLTDEILLEKINAVAEVRRYFHNPTQPLTYLYGWRELNKMRAQLKNNCRKNNEEFSLLKFHKSVLDNPFLQPYLLWTKIFDEYRKPALNFKSLLPPN